MTSSRSLGFLGFLGMGRAAGFYGFFGFFGFLPSSAGVNGTLRDGRGFDQAGSTRHTLLFCMRTCCRTLVSFSYLELEER